MWPPTSRTLWPRSGWTCDRAVSEKPLPGQHPTVRLVSQEPAKEQRNEFARQRDPAGVKDRVPHGGSLVGSYGRDGLAERVGVSPDGSGFSGLVFNYVVRSEKRVDEVRGNRVIKSVWEDKRCSS